MNNDHSQPFWISVRTLGEFVFCRRAGVLMSLQAESEEEREFDQANLDFLPQYSLVVVEEQLSQHLTKLGMWAIWALLVFLGGVVAIWFGWKLTVVAAAILVFLIGRWFSRELRAVMTLADTRRQALQAEPKEPAADLSTSMPVNWWDLLKTGFDSIRVQEILRDEGTKVAGKPWRVLRKGSLRIPVIKLETEKFEAGRFWVYPQHEIRLAAYAHLLATCEGGEVPYGIALFGDSFDGVAIPITADLKAEIFRQLDTARETLRAHSGGQSPKAPANERICSGCPFGKPTVFTEAEAKSVAKKIHGTTARDGQAYHSECGDQFSWTPAHELAKRIGLVPPDA